MKFHTRRRVSPVITIVSLVDILTMVLMFFVYTTTFKTQTPQVLIKLPKVDSASQSATAPSKPVVLSIAPNGDLFLDSKPVTLAELGVEVKRIQAEGRTLQLKGDTDAHFGKVLEVFDVLKGADISNLPAMTQEKR